MSPNRRTYNLVTGMKGLETFERGDGGEAIESDANESH